MFGEWPLAMELFLCVTMEAEAEAESSSSKSGSCPACSDVQQRALPRRNVG
jgi:hypothetical protein